MKPYVYREPVLNERGRVGEDMLTLDVAEGLHIWLMVPQPVRQMPPAVAILLHRARPGAHGGTSVGIPGDQGLHPRFNLEGSGSDCRATRRLWEKMLVVKRELQRPGNAAHRILAAAEKRSGSEYGRLVSSRFERLPGQPELIDVPLPNAEHAVAIAQIEQPDCSRDALMAALVSERHELLAEPMLKGPYRCRKIAIAEAVIADANDPVPVQIEPADRSKEVDVLPTFDRGESRSASDLRCADPLIERRAQPVIKLRVKPREGPGMMKLIVTTSRRMRPDEGLVEIERMPQRRRWSMWWFRNYRPR